MIQNGLSDCGLEATDEDLDGFTRGEISQQLRADWTHFNAYGYYAKAKGIYEKVSNSDTGADNKIRNLCEKLVRL